MNFYRVYERDLITGHLNAVADIHCEFDFEAAAFARKKLNGKEGEVRENLRLIRRFDAVRPMKLAS